VDIEFLTNVTHGNLWRETHGIVLLKTHVTFLLDTGGRFLTYQMKTRGISSLMKCGILSNDDMWKILNG
jgi:hypothetical protein